MSCFDNYIGIKGVCDDAVPSSGYYLNDIGLSLSEIANYHNKEDGSVEDFVNDKINFSIKLIKQNIFTQLQNKIKAKSVLENQVIGITEDNKVLKNGIASTLKGIQLELVNSNGYTSIFVNQIALFTDYTGDVSVLVYDLLQNKLIDTLTVSCVADEISILNLQKLYSNGGKKQQLAFLYDSATINNYATTISEKPCTSCNQKWTYKNRYLNANGVNIASSSSKTMSNLTNVSDTGGLQINYSMQCDYENWFCGIKNLMAIPILYKAGEEIINHGINNYQRINNKNIHLELLNSRRTEYEAKYNEAFSNLLKNMIIPKDDDCFHCNKQLINRIVLP
jgi:hypothetical protein